MAILHPTHTYSALLPKYVSQFRCIGSECEDNCCTGWRVTIDKKTFNAYRQATHPLLIQRFSRKIKRQRSRADDSNYAKIELDSDSGVCPFMENRLCAIQREIGEDKLSNTCFSYPRSTRNFWNQYEQALTLSCPEAARKALLEEDAFDFVQSTITIRPETVRVIKPKYGLTLELMNDVRIFCMQLMRTDGLELWQRLAVLGVFCERLSLVLAGGDNTKVVQLLDDFVKIVQNGQVLGALHDMQPNYPAQAQVFAILLQGKRSRFVSVVQEEVQKAVASGLGADSGAGQVAIENLIRNYSGGVQRLPLALDATPFLLENYLLNEMFRELFPFEGGGVYEHYLRLISRFGLLRLMLAAQCTSGAELPSAARLLQTVQVFCRHYQHDSNFASQVNTALTNTGWSRLEKVSSFLRS